MTTVRLPRDELMSVEEILRQLHDVPEQIAGFTAELTAEELQARPGPEEWSINENLAHLRAAADVWGAYIARILADDQPAFTSMNPRAHMRKTDYPELEFAPSFVAFAEQRTGLLALLEPLGPRGWARTAIVKVYGERFQFSVHYYASKLARHEAAHVPQIEGVAAALAS